VPNYKAKWESGKSFALFAEGQFCSSYPYNWTERLFSVARKGQQLFNYARYFGNDDNGDPLYLPSGNLPAHGELALRFVAAGCWIFPGDSIQEKVDAAIACNQHGNCGTFQDVDQYPYANQGVFAVNYYKNTWDDVHHASTYSATSGLKDIIHLAQTIYYQVRPSYQLECTGANLGQNDSDICCGARLAYSSSTPVNFLGSSVAQYFPANDHLPRLCDGGERDNMACDSDEDCSPGFLCSAASKVCAGGTNDTLACNGQDDCPGGFCGSAVSPMDTSCRTHRTIAHEIGHSMGLQHDDSFTNQNDNSFMHSPGAGEGSILNKGNREQQAHCLKTWDCPRPGGFKWDGDTCDTSCP
jgi:hypothetical protein